MDKILLMGNPNVGKSAIFSRLTGAKVIASNYPGTTVELSRGILRVEGKEKEVIDIPGTYTLDPISEAEKVAVTILDEITGGDKPENTTVVNVIDSTNLERSLNLTLQLLSREIPVIIALNFWDEAQHTGVNIDKNELERILGVPVVSTCGITGEGIKEFVERIKEAKRSGFEFKREEKWNQIGDIINKTQTLTHRHHTLLERFGDFSVQPLSGIPMAILVLFLSFQIVRFIGEGLIEYLFDPLFDRIWLPVMIKLSEIMGSKGILHDILIGKLVDGQIDFGESFGMLTTGLYVPIAAVLPYIISFYLALSILEDSGYLPRLAVLIDNAMHRIGLHGFGIMPMILGLGCNVPGALSTRIMETKRERFLSLTIMAISVPCMAQIAMIMGLVGKEGAGALFIVFGTLFAVWFVLGFIMNKIMKGRAPELFIEIPPYRIPYWKALLKKLWMRVFWFVREAIPWVLVGVFTINILYTLGVIEFIGKIFSPLVSGIFGLPDGAVGGLVVGFLRKDVAVGMLVPLDLKVKQLIIASVVLTMYFPCAATFAVMVKELGVKDMIKSASIMILSTLLVGGMLNLIL
ncbi:MAG TPA: ferrous iron transporter B [Candidatus Krumholzibacteriaceae bacterium]|nr:ferrous iron transporter B [Candidatus Krumholzibacteriaceae bacterium]